MKSASILNTRWSLSLALALVLVIPVAQADMSKSEREQLDRLQRDVQILKRQVDELSRKQPETALQAAPEKTSAFSLGTNPTMGSKDAKIAFIEFSDYQCPYCTRFHEKTFDRLKSKYIDSGKVLYAYRDLPSPSRPQAVKAAIAARCAGAQDKYFDMQKVLFKNATQLRDDSYAKLAKKLGLDLDKFESCMIDNNQLENVEQDLVDGRALGVRGTPTFFIGTIEGNKVISASRIVGALPYNFFKQSLDKALK